VEEQTPAPQGLVHPAATRSLWFDAAEPDAQVRRTLTRERVTAEALLLIAEEGVEALTMRSLGTRLGVATPSGEPDFGCRPAGSRRSALRHGAPVAPNSATWAASLR